jgi:hypothetical protein
MKKLLLLIVTLFLASCMSMPTVSRKELDAAYIKKSVAEAQIQALEKKHVEDLQSNLTKQSETKEKVINGQEVQLQAGANALYSLQQASVMPYGAGLLEYMKARSLEGFTAMGKPPTIKEIVEGQARMKEYFASYQANDPVAIAKLKVEHDRLVQENGALVIVTEAAKKEVEAAKQENIKIQSKYIADTTIAHKDLDEANNKVIDKEKERADAEKKRSDEAAATERLKRQLMMWAGIIAAACVVGAIYSPVFKGQLAMCAAIFGGAAAAIPFIQPWMVFTALGGGVLIIVVYGLYRHSLAEKTNTNLVNAIEDGKQNPDAKIADVLNHISEWNTTYVKDKLGNVTTKVDASVEKYIQDKLIQSGRLDPAKENTPPSGSVS